LRYIFQKPSEPRPLKRKGTKLFYPEKESEVEIQEDFDKFSNKILAFSSVLECSGTKPRSCESCSMTFKKNSVIVSSGSSSSHFLELSILDFTSKQWKRVQSERLPRNRLGFSMTCFKEKVFIYGGWETSDSLKRKVSRKVWIYDFFEGCWQKTIGSGDLPLPRKNHACAQFGRSMIIYGGEDIQGSAKADLFVFDMKSCKWTEADVMVNTSPGPRSHSTLTSVFHSEVKRNERVSVLSFPSINKQNFIKNSGFYLFAGLDEQKQPTNELNGLFIRNNKFLWARVNTTGIPPCPRYSHSACAVHSSLFVFAGRNDAIGNALNDLFCINLDSFKWEKVEVSGSPPRGRWGHAMTSVDSFVLVFGGLTYERFMPTDLYSIETSRSSVESKLKLERKTSSIFP
jgi:N-acetylneuraminic acid mutarotase